MVVLYYPAPANKYGLKVQWVVQFACVCLFFNEISSQTGFYTFSIPLKGNLNKQAIFAHICLNLYCSCKKLNFKPTLRS